MACTTGTRLVYILEADSDTPYNQGYEGGRGARDSKVWTRMGTPAYAENENRMILFVTKI